MQSELLEVLVIRLAVIDVSRLGGLVSIDTTTTTTTATTITTTRELTERFRKLKGLYNLKKNIQCAFTQLYKSMVYKRTKHTKINKQTFCVLFQKISELSVFTA